MSPVAKYLAIQILDEQLDYTWVVTVKAPKYKDEIDAYLRKHHFVFPES